ncbi:MAG: DNA primase [Candidatus Omnitrophica bacterium]|nr:DNA primase [Candidatus Omnitrophota bacterium]
MALIPEQILDEIQARVDIAELIGRSVPLRRAGRHFKALCPFHQERTPSFHVNTEKQIFHCFGCGVGGNIFSFLMQQERLTFPEAARQLAEQAGVTIPAQAAAASRNGKTEQLYGILDKSCRYYERMLAHPSLGRAARDYLKRRGVTDRTRAAFRLGYAPAGWDRLMQAAKRSNISPDLLQQAGLTAQGSRGAIDRFRQRLLFPIQDVRGRVVGFGGRSLAGQEPKYLNSPESAVYTKGRQLFGLAQARDAVVKIKRAIVVEGYFDCALLWQEGLTHVVSPLGTAFTPEQARLLGRYTEEAVLAFDADAAGETATLRGIDILTEAGLRVQVAQLPTGVDPDEFVRAYGRQAFAQLVEQAAGVLEFLIACAKRRYDVHKPEGRVQAAQFILPTIAKVPNAMLRAEYVKRLAESLRLDESAVAAELGKVQPRTAPPSGASPERNRGTAATITVRAHAARASGRSAERLFTALLLDQPGRWEAAKSAVSLDHLTDARLRRILAVLCELQAAQRDAVMPAQVISRLQEDELIRLVSELVQVAQAEPEQDEAFRKCVQRLQQNARKRELDQLPELIRLAHELGNTDEETRLLTNHHQLSKALSMKEAG